MKVQFLKIYTPFRCKRDRCQNFQWEIESEYQKKTTFEKEYTPRWTEEIFTVSKVLYTDPPTYKITDLNGEEIQGSFYEQELQKTKQEIFRIEKIIRKRGDKYLVKWLGYDDNFNSWVDKREIEKLN